MKATAIQRRMKLLLAAATVLMVLGFIAVAYSGPTGIIDPLDTIGTVYGTVNLDCKPLHQAEVRRSCGLGGMLAGVGLAVWVVGRRRT